MDRTPCVLVVDDEPFVPRVLGLKLGHAGYRTVVARNGREGLELIARERPQVVVTDISMPGMTGYELCLEAQRFRAESPFLLIVATSRTDRELRTRVAEIPDLLFFEKPISPRAILRAVEEYLAREPGAAAAPAGAELAEALKV